MMDKRIKDCYEFADPWKKRLIDEYDQLKDRYDRLCARVALMEVDFEMAQHIPSVLDRDHDTKLGRREVEMGLLRRQRVIMEDYLRVLETRIKLEGMPLPCEMEDAGVKPGIKRRDAEDPSDLF